MFWNLCKSSRRKGLYFLLLGVVCVLIVIDAENSSFQDCGKVFRDHSLNKGKQAGVFKRLSRTNSHEKCVKDCCNDKDCDTALFVGKLQACYSVDCETDDACRPVRASKASQKYDLTIFKKEIKGNSGVDTSFSSFPLADDPNRPLIREKRHKSCHHYHGTQSGCKVYLKNKLLYFNRPPVQVEKSLIVPIKRFKQKLSQSCLKYAIAAVCHYAFPDCTDRSQPTPMFLCQEDCHNLYEGVCKNDFKLVTDEERGFLPDCKTLPSSTQTKCIKLGVPEPLEVSSSQALSQPNDKQSKDTKETKEEDEEDLNLFKQQINKKPDASTGQASQNDNTLTDKQTTESSDGNSNIQKQTDSELNPKTNEQPSLRPSISTVTEKENSQQSSLRPSISSVTEKKISQQPSVRPSISTVTEQKISQQPSMRPSISPSIESKISNDDSDEDLDTPKRSKTNDEKDADQNTEKKGLTDIESLPKAANVPTTVSSKTLGLGLKKSLNLLEPTESDSPETSEEPLPTAASPTASKEPAQPAFVNVSKLSNDDVNLDVNDKPTGRGSVVLSGHVTARPQLNQSTASVVASPVPTKASLGSIKSSVAMTSPSKGPTGLHIATKKPSMKTTEAPPTLQVSAGRNKVLTLPTNSIELYASAFPKETAGNPYAYHWQQISAPQDSHGYMEGKDTRRVILTKLSHVGVYQFKVTVKGTNNGAFGFAFVNVTVKPAPRVNKPPRADISPKEQVITLPTNGVVLDGSKSSDDDKIVQYKWEEVKGPLNDKNKVISSGADSPVLQLKSLVPGIYTFKLTVIDSDGEKDSTTATVTVNDEKDYPPVARAGNDVVLTLPVNHVTLNGNSSTDNKGIVSYEWSKAPSSPAVGDMQGTNSPFLKVSNMVVGDYTFILKVTDTGGLSSTSKVTVVVQPEKNMPPVAKAGSDKDLVYPDDSTTLDATESHDDQKIVKYHWEQESGPSKAEISGSDDKIATVKKLQEGHYVFKLTVTDDRGLTGADTVAVSVKKDINQAPVATAGPDVVVHLPNRAAELDGSKSTDDHGITKYLWLRDPKSPAAGDVINKSDHQAILRLSNLVEGMYKFKLTVMDAKGLKSSDEALLTVKEDENSAHLVELYLDVDITRFTEENKGQLIRKLAVILDVQDDDIIVEHLKEAGTGHSMMVMFYVKGGSMAKDGQAVAEMLKAKIENEEGFFEFRMLKVEPYICRNNCSFHGYCDRRTKLCVCESFWMQDIFKSSFGVKESNCDWSILYVTVIIFGIVMGIGGIIWGICFCLGRRRRGRSRRRHRYPIIDEDDDDKAESMEMLPKHKYSSLTLTDSDEDSDETTLFEAKKRIPNGSVNGSIGRKAM